MVGNDESPLLDTEVHFLRSEHVGDEFKVLIAHCGSPAVAPVSALYFGDAVFNFGTAVEIVRMLNLTDHLPPLLVIGIGYRTTSMTEILDLRCRDFTPSIDLTDSTDRDRMGGARSFLAFIRDELQPWVQESQGVDPADSALFGYSLGGLFATYVLLNEPTSFRRYGIGSPSLWWDKEVMFEHEAEYARSHSDLRAKVYLSVGEYETPDGRTRFREQLSSEKKAKVEAEDRADPPTDMVGAAGRMVAMLRSRGYPNLEVDYNVLPGEYHETAPPATLSRALRSLFDAPN